MPDQQQQQGIFVILSKRTTCERGGYDDPSYELETVEVEGYSIYEEDAQTVCVDLDRAYRAQRAKNKYGSSRISDGEYTEFYYEFASQLRSEQ